MGHHNRYIIIISRSVRVQRHGWESARLAQTPPVSEPSRSASLRNHALPKETTVRETTCHETSSRQSVSESTIQMTSSCRRLPSSLSPGALGTPGNSQSNYDLTAPSPCQEGSPSGKELSSLERTAERFEARCCSTSTQLMAAEGLHITAPARARNKNGARAILAMQEPRWR